jgi:hypothetical protein
MPDRDLVLGDSRMPSARSVLAILRDQLNEGVLTERKRRGDVHAPEDTFGMQRSLAAVIDVCGEYGRAFTTVAKEARAVAEEELIDALGEQEGVPNGGLTVPDAEGDVRIDLDTANSYAIDLGNLLPAVAFAVMTERVQQVEALIDPHDENAEGEDILADLLIAAMSKLIDTGKYEPQVSKVRAFKAALSRLPDADGVASTVEVRKTVSYRGVKVSRKEPK